jgi:carbamoyltransferase
VGEFSESAGDSHFTLFRTYVKQCQRGRIPAVVHVDGSARPQTVTRDRNPVLYDLLLAFERNAGAPVLLNTSFNVAGEPIVCTPEVGICTFLKTGLDLRVPEDLLVIRRWPGAPEDCG